MPTEAWYVLIICAAVVVIVALLKGRGLKITKDSVSVDPASQTSPPSGISVAEGARISHSTTGDIVGVSGTNEGQPTPPVDVLRKATIEGSRIGDVAGIKRGTEPNQR